MVLRISQRRKNAVGVDDAKARAAGTVAMAAETRADPILNAGYGSMYRFAEMMKDHRRWIVG